MMTMTLSSQMIVALRLSAALVNPVGGENHADSTERPEMVYLLTPFHARLSLGGWSV
jgi:hypothetical protein